MPEAMETVGLLLLLFTAFGAEGSTCPFPSPQCYKESTLPDEDFHCEWEDPDRSKEAVYTLFIHSTSDVSPYPADFQSGNEQNVQVPLESVLIAVQSDIWVQKQTENMTCISPNTSVFLNGLVKYSTPHIQKMVRSAGIVTLNWHRAKDNKGAFYEIRWKDFYGSWQNDTFQTEDSTKANQDSTTLHLENHLMYQVQVRRRAIEYNLWSHWSDIIDVPVEIQAPVVHWKEEKTKRMRRVVLNWDPPPFEASIGGVTYNLTLSLPCETKTKTTKKTSYYMNVTDSEARVSIIAINSVSESASQEITIPNIQHLKNCRADSGTLPQKKHFCLEWYKLSDGETRPIHVNTSRNATVQSIKKDMEKFVRYYYFVHVKKGRQLWHTKIMCPIYSSEGAPVAGPQNITVNVTHDSALLLWRPIPVQDQRGFLLHYAIWILRQGGEIDYHEVPENQTSFRLRNLTTGSSYTVYISGRTKVGEGPNATANFLIPTSFAAPSNVLSKVILSVGGVVLVFSVFFSIALRRFKKKILPMIPSPVITATASEGLHHQNLSAATEEVHEVILLSPDDLDKQNKANQSKESTILQDCQLSVYEEDDEEDEDDDANFTSSFPNPNYRGQTLRLSETLAVDKGQRENNCDSSTPSYRHSSVL
ncbi:interleukin-12 receptor subunit beta-1 [Pygocentrus nattereri]|uniref:Interleukin 12 receptor subunit beta 1 n=1 Tax=Pygocentrus nattereri TaxID=42514 RepID=A0A3B4C807_PYGNA|nr:interleukin-12 receptor subunit beta-1 [Pygocentrus nattereri]